MTYVRFSALVTGCVFILLVLTGSLPHFRFLLPLFKFSLNVV